MITPPKTTRDLSFFGRKVHKFLRQFPKLVAQPLDKERELLAMIRKMDDGSRKKLFSLCRKLVLNLGVLQCADRWILHSFAAQAFREGGNANLRLNFLADPFIRSLALMR